MALSVCICRGFPGLPARSPRTLRALLAWALLGCAPVGLAAAETPGQDWICRATIGTAYEYDPAANHWQTRLYPVDERWLVTPGPSPRSWQAAPLAAPESGSLICIRASVDGADLACGAGARLTLNLAQGWFAVSLPPVPGRELVARTAAGRCQPALPGE